MTSTQATASYGTVIATHAVQGTPTVIRVISAASEAPDRLSHFAFHVERIVSVPRNAEVDRSIYPYRTRGFDTEADARGFANKLWAETVATRKLHSHYSH